MAGTLAAVACKNNYEGAIPDEQKTLLKAFINTSGDTIPTGKNIPITEKHRTLTTLVNPEIIPISSNDRTKPAHPHIHPAGEPQVVLVPRKLKQFPLGQGDLSNPDTLLADQTVVPAYHSKPRAATPLQMRDNAVTNIQYLSVEEGLSNNIIHSILEDSRGNLWFGSRDETLTMYDGVNLSFFHNSEDVPEHGFTHLSLLEDENGHIWFGTRSGLGRYDGHHFTYYSNEDSYKYNGVTRLLLDRQGNIWFGTRNYGVGRFDGQSFIHYSSKEGLSHHYVTALLEDSQGNLWFGTAGGGVNRFDGRTFTMITTEEGLCHNSINALLEDRQGHLWFATDGGVCRLVRHGNQLSFSHYTEEEGLSSNAVLELYEDSQGNFWFGTRYMGLNRFDGKTFTYFDKENGMNSNIASAIIEDTYGNIWIGTDEGVHRYGIFEFKHYYEALGYAVNDIEEDNQGNIWFAVSGGWPNGVVRFNGSSFRFFTGSHEDLDFLNVGIHALTVDHRNNIWLGSGNRGVAHFNPLEDPGTLNHFNIGEGWGNFLISITEDSQGHFWFGTLEGLRHFDGNHLTNYILPAGPGIEFNLAGPIAEDDEQNIWFGHLQYLGVLAPPLKDPLRRDSFVCFTTNEGMPHSLVVDMQKGQEGRMWIGTEGGVSFFDGKSFTNFTQEDGLVHRKVYSLEIDSARNIWAGTQNGLSLLVPDASDGAESPAYKIFNFEKSDGLKQADFLYHSSFIDSKNRIWWGKSKGAMMLDLNQLRLPTKPPLMRLLHIDVKQQFIDYRRLADIAYAQTLDYGEKLAQSFDEVAPFYNYPLILTLPHDLNHLTFHFSGIDWASPHQLRYSYLLEGFDENWSLPQREPKVEFHNLPHDTYTLKVKAIGAAQIWSEPFEYTFTILPPWWLSWWAYSLYIIAFLTLVAGLFLFQRRRLQLKASLQLQLERAERLNELDHFKSRFYTNITHEFRTPLTVIMGIANQINSPEKAKTLILRNGERLLNMVNQLLDLSKLETNSLSINWIQADIILYLQNLTESYHSLATNKKLNLAFFSPLESQMMDFDEQKMQQILLNLVGNALKFTPEYGSVKVIASKITENNTPALKIEVKDTGIGIPPEKLPYIFDRFYQAEDSTTRAGEGSGIGLSLVKELVKLLEGHIEVESEVGKGSCFKILLPIHQKACEKDPRPGYSVLPDQYTPSNVKERQATASNHPEAEKPLVLIIEDNKDITDYIISCLEPSFTFETAQNGRLGMEKAIATVPDAILCDVMMPEMDGFEVCRQLKSDRRTSHIPVIMITAKATQQDKITGLERGADAYLNKPFDEKELMIRLTNLISTSKQKNQRLSEAGQAGKAVSASEKQEVDFLREVQQIIHSNISNELFDTNHLCRTIALSRTQLHRKLKALTGQSTASYIRSIRLQKAKSLLKNSDLPIGEIADRVGYKDFSHFSRSFLKEFGMQPSETRK